MWSFHSLWWLRFGFFSVFLSSQILEHFMLPFADKLYGDTHFLSQQDLAPARGAKTASKWCTDHVFTVFDWIASFPDLHLAENLWGIVKRKMRYTQPKNTDELKAAVKANLGFSYTSAAPKLIISKPRCTDALACTESINEHTFWTFLHSLFFLDWSNDLRYWFSCVTCHKDLN